jgi:hypothetical protein
MTTLMFALALLAATPQAACTPQFAPLSTGTSSGADTLDFWRQEQAGTWGGDGWLGWDVFGEPEAFLPVGLMVRDREKDRVDDDDYVTVEAVPNVTYAVRCIRGITPGSVKSVGIVHHELQFEGPRRVTLGARKYELRLESAPGDVTNSRVVLTDGKRKQVLYSTDGFVDDPHFIIEWGGDLDRDGRLDLIVNLSRKYSVHPIRLLLSSHATGTDLVGEAAVFETGD